MAERISRFALELGPACRSTACDGTFRQRVSERIEDGVTFEDAVLGELFARRTDRPAIGGEVLAMVMRDLTGTFAGSVPAHLRHAAAPSDLMQSVLGDLCAALDRIEYRSRPQFLALLSQRLRWKRLDYEKRLVRDRRREDLRVEGDLELANRAGTGPSPATEMMTREEAGRIALAIQRMPERDRILLRMSLRGESHEAIGAAVGLSPEASRKALERARSRLRALVDDVAKQPERRGTS